MITKGAGRGETPRGGQTAAGALARRNAGDQATRIHLSLAVTQEYRFESGYNYAGNDLCDFSGVDSEEAALAIFLEHPEADMYVYGVPGCGKWFERKMWLKRSAAIGARAPLPGIVAGFRRGRGGSHAEAYDRVVEALPP